MPVRDTGKEARPNRYRRTASAYRYKGATQLEWQASGGGVAKMKNRARLYAGVLLGIAGSLSFAAQIIGWRGMWPFLVLVVGAAFWMPIFIWWERHQKLAGLAIPGSIIMTNGVILLVQNVTGRWESWSYAWTLELIGIGVGLLALYALGKRERGVLVAASIVGGIGVIFFIILATAFSRFFRLLGPLVLILIGLLAILSGASQRVSQETPDR